MSHADKPTPSMPLPPGLCYIGIFQIFVIIN